jgi:hypothetical protein
VTWQEAASYSGEASSWESVILDDLGRQQVNPLHSFQVRPGRTNASIVANDGYGMYIGEVGIRSAHLQPSLTLEGSFLVDLNSWATRGANRALPIKPVYDLPVILAELTEAKQLVDGLKGLATSLRRLSRSKEGLIANFDALLKGTGEATIAFLFGSKPLAESLVDLVGLHQRIESRIRRLLSQQGKWSHFEVELLKEQSRTQAEIIDASYPILELQSYIVENRATKTVTESDRIWYEGWVRLNPFEGTPTEVREDLRHLLMGGDWNGRVLYELMPFSWLLDWYTSWGAFIENVMTRNLYSWRMPCIMHETVEDINLRGHVAYKDTASTTKVARVSAQNKVTVKRRMPHWFDTPGFSSTGMTALRGSILLGLGLAWS